MLLHLSTLALVIFLGAIVGASTSRHEDDDGLPLAALTDQANDHQQFVYDVDNSVNSSFVCNPTQINTFWNNGVQTHINRAPHEDNCRGGHVVSRYINSLQHPTGPKIRNIRISNFNRATGLLEVSRYEYRTGAGGWPYTVKTLWNDRGADIGQTLTNLGVIDVPAGFPMQGWTSYQLIGTPGSEVERQCKRSLLAYQGCPQQGAGSYLVPSHRPGGLNLCVSVAMTINQGRDHWATCFPRRVNAVTGGEGTPCQ